MVKTVCATCGPRYSLAAIGVLDLHDPLSMRVLVFVGPMLHVTLNLIVGVVTVNETFRVEDGIRGDDMGGVLDRVGNETLPVGEGNARRSDTMTLVVGLNSYGARKSSPWSVRRSLVGTMASAGRDAARHLSATAAPGRPSLLCTDTLHYSNIRREYYQMQLSERSDRPNRISLGFIKGNGLGSQCMYTVQSCNLVLVAMS